MHEATLASNIINICKKYAAERNGKVKEVRVMVGELAGVMPDSMKFAFDVIKKGTALEDAKLTLTKFPVAVSCDDCGAEYEPKNFPYTCPQCKSRMFKIIRGEEVYVKEMEMET